MNRLLFEKPTAEGSFYAALAPTWFTLIIRISCGALAAMFAWYSLRAWNQLSLSFKIAVCLIVPPHILMAVHPRGWVRMSSEPFFLVDRLGMYFPERLWRMTHVDRMRWLFIPWANIANIGVEKAMSADGRSLCAAFDVKATSTEVQEFLVGNLRPNQPSSDGTVHAAFYTNAVPHPRKVVAIVQDFAARHRENAGSEHAGTHDARNIGEST